jgi:hypothetical protein
MEPSEAEVEAAIQVGGMMIVKAFAPGAKPMKFSEIFRAALTGWRGKQSELNWAATRSVTYFCPRCHTKFSSWPQAATA